MNRADSAQVDASVSATIVIANYDGVQDLPSCLDSISKLDYPNGLVKTIVVDNGSTDGSVALLKSKYPWVRVLQQEKNLGFAPAVNIGVSAAESDVVVLLNNDMVVEADWLRELISAYDPDSGYVCVAGTILDWAGEKIDFAGSILNWHGMGDQVGYGLPVGQVSIRDKEELLFACGGAMLVSRDVYLQVGGLDPEYFAYYEDIDFGWRLWLSGYKVRLCAKARCQHRHNGTSGRFPFYQRALLYERNALRTLIKNLDEENLGRMLGPALLLMIQRTLKDINSDRKYYEFGSPKDQADSTLVSHSAIARLQGIGDVIKDLDALMVQRRRIQLGRKISDREVLSRFKQPFRPLGAGDDAYLDAAESIRRNFRIEESFDSEGATRVVVLGYDVIGAKMAGPSVRSWEIAKALAKTCSVTLVSTTKIERTAPGVTNLSISGTDDELRNILVDVDVAIVQGYVLDQFPCLRSVRSLVVVDLYDPWVFENLEIHSSCSNDRLGDHYIRRDVDVQTELLDVGDFFICASERQRDYWLGMLTARGRVDRAVYLADRSLRSLIDVLPYGCPVTPPVAQAQVLKGIHPAIPLDSIVVVWGGGTWEWFDPVLALDAFAEAHQQDPRLRLYFMGATQSSSLEAPGKTTADQLRRRSDELGMTNKSVVFGDWVPYDQRASYLLEADMGIIATKDLAEVRLAFRSRILDHFWTGLPTISTDGDVLASVLQTQEAGIVVPTGNRTALKDAILNLATDSDLRTRLGKNAQALAEQYQWDNAVKSLYPILDNPSRFRAVRRERPRSRQMDLHEDAQLLLARRHRGLMSQLAHQSGLIARLKRSRFKPLLKWFYSAALGVKRKLLRR